MSGLKRCDPEKHVFVKIWGGFVFFCVTCGWVEDVFYRARKTRESVER